MIVIKMYNPQYVKWIEHGPSVAWIWQKRLAEPRLTDQIPHEVSGERPTLSPKGTRLGRDFKPEKIDYLYLHKTYNKMKYTFFFTFYTVVCGRSGFIRALSGHIKVILFKFLNSLFFLQSIHLSPNFCKYFNNLKKCTFHLNWRKLGSDNLVSAEKQGLRLYLCRR